MKKSFLFAAMMTAMLVGCSKNKVTAEKELDADFELETVEALPYGEPVTVKGTVSGSGTVRTVVFTGAKKGEDGTYTAVGEAQEGIVEGNEASVEFFADSKDINAIEVRLASSDASKTFHFDTPEVTGEAKGDVWFNDAVALYPDNKVANHENDPVTWPDEFTGAGSDTKSFFSMHGVAVNGKTEHVLSLNDLLAVDGKNASFCFLNCLENTAKTTVTFIGSQRGYMFSGMKKASLGGGTTGRQCDVYQYGLHQIKDENVDADFTMTYVRGSWAGESYHAETFQTVDRIFAGMKSAETNLEKIKAFHTLGEIQRQLDNATLGEADEPTSLNGKTYVRKWVNAGNGKSLEEVLRAGDYIIIRSKRGDVENPVYYYGIMQIVMFEGDDSKCFVTEDGLSFIDKDKAYDLFMKPVYLDIKTQCEIAQ